MDIWDTLIKGIIAGLIGVEIIIVVAVVTVLVMEPIL